MLSQDVLIADRRTGAPDSERLFFLAWLSLLVIAGASTIAVYIQIANSPIPVKNQFSVDFIVFWTAVQSLQPYDPEALTAAQRWYVESDALRPFAYPPSFLPWIKPFGLLPLIPSYVLWTASTAALFLISWRGLVEWRVLAITAAAPAFIYAAIPGQAVFLLGALIVGGLRMAKGRPILAGILLGLAATIKPQIALLIPLALAAGGHWRALQVALLSGAMIGMSGLLFQGVDLWRAWLHSLPRFFEIVVESSVIGGGITPTSFFSKAQIERPLATLLAVLAALLAIAALWRTFRTTEDILCRILVLNVATLLVLPYGLTYELALSAPAATALLLNRRLHPIATLVAFMMFTTAGKQLALIGMCLVLLWASTRGGSLFRHSSEIRLAATDRRSHFQT